MFYCVQQDIILGRFTYSRTYVCMAHAFIHVITHQRMCACCTMQTWTILWMHRCKYERIQVRVNAGMLSIACFGVSLLPSFLFLPSYPPSYLISFLACFLLFCPSCELPAPVQCSILRFDGFLKCLVLASSQRLLDLQ